jgi:predicted nucleic acid-binding Zn ribbon protein
MPKYEFRCPDGTIIERVFKMSEVPDAIPSPNGDGMATRMISGGADLIFKGSGFYITDYGKDGKKDQRDAAERKSGSAKPSSSAKSDVAPATSESPGKESSSPAKESGGGAGKESSDSGSAGSKGGSNKE